MNYAILAAELELPAYAGLTDQQATDLINTANIPVRQRVAIARLQATAMEQSVYMALQTAIATPETPPQLLALCHTVLDLVNARFDDIDLDNPRAQTMFAALQQYGIINQAQAAAIDALATADVISRAQQLGIGVVTVADVERSRIYPQIEALRVRAASAYNLVVAALDAATTVPEWTDLVDVFEAA